MPAGIPDRYLVLNSKLEISVAYKADLLGYINFKF